MLKCFDIYISLNRHILQLGCTLISTTIVSCGRSEPEMTERVSRVRRKKKIGLVGDMRDNEACIMCSPFLTSNENCELQNTTTDKEQKIYKGGNTKTTIQRHRRMGRE